MPKADRMAGNGSTGRRIRLVTKNRPMMVRKETTKAPATSHAHAEARRQANRKRAAIDRGSRCHSWTNPAPDPSQVRATSLLKCTLLDITPACRKSIDLRSDRSRYCPGWRSVQPISAPIESIWRAAVPCGSPRRGSSNQPAVAEGIAVLTDSRTAIQRRWSHLLGASRIIAYFAHGERDIIEFSTVNETLHVVDGA